MEEFSSEIIRYRFGAMLQKWDFFTFGLTINMHKSFSVYTPNIVFDLGKFTFTFGWCQLTKNSKILI